MNRQKWTILLVALALISGAATSLSYMRKHQKLGQPGIKNSAIAGSPRLELYLPERVLEYTSQSIPIDTNLLNGLPHDTSFAMRVYLDPVTNWIQMRIVLMGTDRTSIHKPEFCLTGVGWNIDSKDYETIHIGGARPYDLEVRKFVTTRETKVNGRDAVFRGVYVYWYVAENELTARDWTRMTKTATHLLTTGELQRWAYVSCFAVCLPGGENATYERLKKFIVASVPEFQLVSGVRDAGAQWSQASSQSNAN